VSAQLDHLVVWANTLDEGVQWCEATLGVTPGPGGEHPLMGTHNRLLALGSPGFENSYLEILALQPGVPGTRASTQARWFDMDNEALRERVAQRGPQLVHWVARVHAIHTACQSLAALGIDRGPAIAASRDTPQGLLQWRIAVRPDGQRLLDGTLPTLIEWSGTHPATRMAASGVQLTALQLQHPKSEWLGNALQTLNLNGVDVRPGEPALCARLQCPKGLIEITS